MTTGLLERAIEAAQRLSPREKYELIEAVARSLSQTDTLEANSAAFLRGHTLDELIAAQQPPIVTDLDALGADFWPEDESADDINDYIEAQRRLDREPR
jgi:purine nucleoside permease